VSFAWNSISNIKNPSGIYQIRIIGNDYCIDSGTVIGNVKIGNVRPVVRIKEAEQKIDGTQQVVLKFKVWDADQNPCKAKIMWAASSNGSFVNCSLVPDSIKVKYSDTGGIPKVEVTSNYQIGNEEGRKIVTKAGTNEVEVVWDAKKDVPDAEGIYWIKVICSDDDEQGESLSYGVLMGNDRPEIEILRSEIEEKKITLVRLRIKIRDKDKDELRVKVEWSKNKTVYKKCTIKESLEASGEDIYVNNYKEYQIGDLKGKGIKNNGVWKEIEIVWDKAKDIGESVTGDYWLKVVVNDRLIDSEDRVTKVKVLGVKKNDVIVSRNVLEREGQSIVLQLNLDERMKIEINVYDIRGYKIKGLAKGIYSKGLHTLEWRGETEGGKMVSNGRYWIIVKTDKWKKIIPLAIVK